MFPQNRLVTREVWSEVPIDLQLFMWRCIDELTIEADWLQVFTLTAGDGHQNILHEHECPPYKKEYTFPYRKPLNAKLFVINDETHATMLFAHEY